MTLGLNTEISIGKQSTFAKPSTLPRQKLNVYSISGGQTEPDESDPILGANYQNVSDPREPAPAIDDHRITVRAPLCLVQAGWWFAAFFGSETASGAPSDYTHLWKSGAALPIIFLEHMLTAGKYRQHYGLVGEKLSIDLDANASGFGMMEMTFVGIGEDKATAALTGTVTATPTLDRPAQQLCSVLYNAVAGGDIIGGKLEFSRKLKRHRAADGTGLPYAVEQDGISELTGSLRARYSGTETMYDDASAKTERAIEMQLMRTAARGIKINLPHARLSRTPIDVDGPDGIELDYNFRAWQTSADAAMEFRTLNGSATQAFT